MILLTGIAQEDQALAETGGIKSVTLAKPLQLKELLDTIKSELAAPMTYQAEEMKGRHHSIAMANNTAQIPDFDRLAPPHESEAGADFSSQVTPTVDFSFPDRPSDPGAETKTLRKHTALRPARSPGSN